MKRVFRSIINFVKEGNPTIPIEELHRNWRAYRASRVKPEDKAYLLLDRWIETHFKEQQDIPQAEILFQRAAADGNEPILVALREIAVETPFISSNYRAVLKDKFEEQSKDKFQAMLTDTWKVVQSGMKIKGKEIKGIPNAIEYFTTEARNYRINLYGIKTEGNIRTIEEGNDVRSTYRKRKESPVDRGMYTFLEKIDDVCHGLKPGELMLLAGFVGEGKTTLSANLAYNGIYQGLNGLYIPLEMTFQEMKEMFYCLHTGCPDWLDHPEFKNMVGKVSYERFTYGQMSEQEQAFFDYASNDFDSREDFGELYIYQPPDHLTPSRVELMAYDYNASLQEKGKQLDFLMVDYCGLMVPDKGEKYGDWNIDLNIIIKRLKNLSLQFDNGRGLRIISPFQTNRQGKTDAEKNDGIYKLSALSNANEAERSSDLVISMFMTREMQKAGLIKISCLKHRRGALFPTFEAKIDFQSKNIRDIIQKATGSSDEEVSVIPMDLS